MVTTLSLKKPLYAKHLLGAATLSLLALVSLSAAQPVHADGGSDEAATTQCQTSSKDQDKQDVDKSKCDSDKSKSDSDKSKCDSDKSKSDSDKSKSDSDGSKGDQDILGGSENCPIGKSGDDSSHVDNDNQDKDKEGHDQKPVCGPPSAVPEPGTFALLGVGALGMVPLAFRARKSRINDGK